MPRAMQFPQRCCQLRSEYHDVQFKLEPAKTGGPNAIVARGQTIKLPAGSYNRVYLLAASADGDQNADFRIGDRAIKLNIQDWSGFIGQWDTRHGRISQSVTGQSQQIMHAWPPA